VKDVGTTREDVRDVADHGTRQEEQLSPAPARVAGDVNSSDFDCAVTGYLREASRPIPGEDADRVTPGGQRLADPANADVRVVRESEEDIDPRAGR
jgi:hypothetical protein